MTNFAGRAKALSRLNRRDNVDAFDEIRVSQIGDGRVPSWVRDRPARWEARYAPGWARKHGFVIEAAFFRDGAYLLRAL